MAEPPRVSICIPAYRQTEYLRKTLQSIETQTFADYEVVITDDSPDDSVATLVMPMLSDRRWTYQRNERPLGSPANWNEAIAISKSPLIKVLHHDDRFARNDALETYVRTMDENPQAGFAFSSSLVEDERSSRVRLHRPTAQQVSAVRGSPAVLFAGNVIGAPSATIHRRELGLEYDTSLKWLVDVEFYIRALRQSSDCAFIGEALIVTAHNAEHQVTQVVQHDPAIDLGEHWIVFERFNAAEREFSLVAGEWSRLFFKYGIMTVGQLLTLLPAAAGSESYFDAILRRNRSPLGQAAGLARRLRSKIPSILSNAANGISRVTQRDR